MTWLLYCIIALISIYFSHENDELHVISRSGQVLPLYTNIFYNIINKKSGKMWIHQNEMVPQTFEPTNGSYWWMMYKFNNKRDDYLLANGYGFGNNYHLERADDESYFIYDSS
jgi:hypothetical protein